MELKFIVLDIDYDEEKYQSNLYGIEIDIGWRSDRQRPLYQSNLYGIEMYERNLQRIQAREYQSNLYGIEISSWT